MRSLIDQTEVSMKKICVIALAAAFGTAAWAQKFPSGNAAYDGLDKNRDGYLSKEEVAGEKELAKRLAKFDANRDGKLSMDEYIKANKENDERIAVDSTITTKIKAKYLAEKGLPSTAISVSTYEGTVTLTGTVASKEQVATAGRIAAATDDVKKVDNKLMAK
jgi:hyperosmotically inducible protein